MFALLADMFKRGNPIDIAWFLVGAWLLLAFSAMMVLQVVRRLRRKGPKDPQDRFQ
jgi:hypothetical protein